MIRKANTILSIVIMLVFLLHSIMGSFTLLRLTISAWKALAWAGVCLIVVHTLIGIYLTAETLQAQRGSVRPYLRENSEFWIRRITGLAIVILMLFHFDSYGEMQADGYVVFPFTTLKLVLQLLLAAALFIHIFINVRPLLVSMGVLGYEKKRHWIFPVLSLIVLLTAVSIII